jgi:hypothetical protein
VATPTVLLEAEKSQLSSGLLLPSLGWLVAVVSTVASQMSFSQHHLLGLNLEKNKRLKVDEKDERNFRNQINSLGSTRHNVISLTTAGRSLSKVALASCDATSRRTLSLGEHSGNDKAQN